MTVSSAYSAGKSSSETMLAIVPPGASRSRSKVPATSS